MPRRLLFALLILVAAPLALLGWVSSTQMRRQSENARKQIQGLLKPRLSEIDQTLAGVIDEYQRRLSAQIIDGATIDQLKRLGREDPIVRQGIFVDSSGAIVYPSRPVASDSEAVALFASLPAMIDGRPASDSATTTDQYEPNIQVQNLVTKGQVTRVTKPLRAQVRQKAVPAMLGGPSWQVWYLDEGMQLVLWFPFDDGSAAGVLLERARWISDLTVALPDTVSPTTNASTPIPSAAGVAKTPGFTALVDQAKQTVYRWGDEGERTDSPLAAVSLSPPLATWQLEYHADESLIPAPDPTALFVSLAALAVALLALGSYVLTSVQRQMRAARNRVTFAGQVSHELRTPLTNIRLYAELAESDLESIPESVARESVAKRLDVIDAESRRLGRLVSGVLEMIRDDRKQRGPKIVQTNPDDLIAQTLDQFEPSFHKAGLSVHRDAGADKEVGIDPDIFEMVLINLLSNVEKYAADGKMVDVSSHLTDGELIVTISDHGRGIPWRHRRRIFRPFSRLDNSISAPSGTGIGLAIARRAARRHGGELKLIPSPNGTCFELRIPVQRPA